MRVTNAVSTSSPSQIFSASKKSQKLSLSQDSLSKDVTSVESKSSYVSFFKAISSLFSKFFNYLSSLLCYKVVKKETTENSRSTDSLQNHKLPKMEEKSPHTTKNKSGTIPPLEIKPQPQVQSIEKDEGPAPTVQRPTPKTIAPNYDKQIRELQSLVNSAPVHPLGPTLGKDLAFEGVYEKAQRILISIKNPQTRYDAYIKFADSIVNPALRNLETKYPTIRGAKQAAEDAIATFTYLLRLRQNCLNFSSEEMRQVKGSYSTVVPEGYLPTRLNIQLLGMIQEWNKSKDPYFDQLGSFMTSFLVRPDISKWNQRSGFFEVFQKNFVDFRS